MTPRQLKSPAAQRASGRLALEFKHDPTASRTRVERFYQQGCLKARLPRPLDGIAEVIVLNISGGIAGGDVLNTEITLADRAECCVTSQSAERVYRSPDFLPAEIRCRIRLGPNARLDYLPQETILFNGFALRRRLEIELAESSHFLGVESLIFGRQAMGEAVRFGSLRDLISLRRNGALVLYDVNRLDGAIAAQLARKAVTAGNIAVASLIYAGPDEAILPRMREAMAATGCEAGASAFDAIVFGRILAANAKDLRRCVAAVLQSCRNGRALPRSWQS